MPYRDKEKRREYHRKYMKRWRNRTIESEKERGGLLRGGNRNVRPLGREYVIPFVPNVRPSTKENVIPVVIPFISRQQAFKETVLSTRDASNRAMDALVSGLTPWTRIVYLDEGNVIEPSTGEILGRLEPIEDLTALDRLSLLENTGKANTESIRALSFRVAGIEIETVSGGSDIGTIEHVQYT